MKRATLIFALAFLASATASADDKHDTDLIPADFEVLSGTYTNVREFKVLSGRTVFVGQATGLYIYAGTVTIQGVLNADGRGYAGGSNGANVGTGLPGGQGFGPGPGAGGAASKGGGGGGYGNTGGNGDGGGAGGIGYNSTTTISVPLSADDIFMGSGGGGGGGGDINTISGAGGGGGGLVYLEAHYVTVAGTITANGLDGGAGLDSFDCATSPGGGGGGAGGGIMIRAIKDLSLSNTVLAANGGRGGATICFGVAATSAGGGGAGGRIRLVYNSTVALATVLISTSAGKGGEEGLNSGTYAPAGSSGTVSYGILPSSPTGLALTNVFTSSITYSWDAKPAGWGGPASLLPGPTWYQFRLYESTSAAPLSDFYTGVMVSSDVTTVSETGLIPNTTYYRFITAYTDYGDGMPSGTVSTHTFAAAPQAVAGSAFPSSAADSITFTWSSGTVASGFNPAYTTYEVTRSTHGDFSLDVSTLEITAISSAPAGLAIDTTYYFRVRAHGLNTAYTAFTPVLSTVTLCVPPSYGTFTAVNVDSFTFAWSSGSAAAGFNPAWTLYDAQISVDSFQTIFASTRTAALVMISTNLAPGTFYSARARAVNSNGTPTDFTLSVATAPGNFTNLEAPGRPEPPTPTSKFSYNGSATFAWYPPSGPVGLFRYWLEIGTTPGDNDFLAGSSVPANTLSYSATGLLSDRSYYARVRAESMAGVLGEFSNAGPGVAVWLSETVNPITKPYNWPNPFDPALAPTNIGFNLVSPAQVTLKIFTLQGALVYETDANEISGGNKIWQWNGKNGRGSMVEPGGYIGLIIKRYAGGTDTQKFKMAVLY